MALPVLCAVLHSPAHHTDLMVAARVIVVLSKYASGVPASMALAHADRPDGERNNSQCMHHSFMPLTATTSVAASLHSPSCRPHAHIVTCWVCVRTHLSSAVVALMTQLMGPLALISAFIAFAPATSPYSVTTSLSCTHHHRSVGLHLDALGEDETADVHWQKMQGFAGLHAEV